MFSRDAYGLRLVLLLLAISMVPVAIGYSSWLGPLQQQTYVKLLASDGEASDQFGTSVSVLGPHAVVGAENDDDLGNQSGSAYIFEQSPDDGTWSEVSKLLASDGDAGDTFGDSVALSDGVVVVGAVLDEDNGNRSGSAYVFEREPDGSWLEVAKLLPSDGGAHDRFGRALAVFDGVIVVGATGDDDLGSNSGAAYVFERDLAGDWLEVAKLLASDGADNWNFGTGVSVSDNVVIVGASVAGAAYLFEREVDGSWNEIQKLVASGGLGDYFGFSVSIAGDDVVVGAPGDDDLGSASGSAYLFERQPDGVWLETEKFLASDGEVLDEAGWVVAVADGTAVVGAIGDDDIGNNSGAAYVYRRQPNGDWVEVEKLVAPDEAAPSFFDFAGSVAVSGGSVAVGVSGDDDSGPSSGSAYLFEVRSTLVLSISGVCPGEIDINISGGSVSDRIGLLRGTMKGQSAVGVGPCAGVESGLERAELQSVLLTDSDGAVSATRTAPASACGQYLQALDAASCVTSNLVQVPVP